ncbi:unnamed protein product [Chondrus crispus]|uniref:UBA domain-containing protein n=1 Tax=Chondrus crispus TaxID=2769 RepID=R7Q813_CHOCR|nr:unnamed protein product [Chondrus crispus]CDF34179.1 unnamed protein product [Chondrus crispus]|eukprot:XP_005713998.1 unnamed protein product [Chondrus crispus]
MTPQEALDHPSPSASTASRGLLPHSKWALIRTLHQLLLGALGNGGNEVRELVVQSKLPYALRKILAQPFLHGGNLFQSAASVTTEIAHTEPTATPDLVKAGLASTVLRTIGVGLPPCGEAVRCIPNILAALCLAPTAKKVIVEAKPLKRFLLRLATPFYTRALHGETPVLIGSALDELMRHVEPLRSHGNEAVIEYLRLSAKFIETDSKGFKRLPRPNSSPGDVVRGSNSANVPTSDGKPSGTAPGQVVSLKGDLDRNTPDGVLLERMKLAVANNSCRLVGFAQGSSEHQQGIVDNGGLKYMIQLRDAPALASAETCIRDGQSSARHYPTPANTVHSLVSALKTFGSRHYAALVRILFSVILEDAAVVLKIAKDLDERWLPEEDTSEAVDIETQEIGQYVSRQDSSSDSGAKSVVSLGVQPHLQSIEMKEVDKPSEATSSSEDTKEAVTSNGQTKNRVELREKMRTALKQLRVAVVLLTRMPRGGSLNTLTSPSVWEASRGSQVAAIVSTVERAARYHLAVVYTGLTLSAANDGDLSNARVTATSDPELKPIRPEQCEEIVGNLGKLFGTSIETNPDFVQACQRYRVPPEGYAPLRQNVEGLAWCLVTFAVAAQRLYSVLSKALVSSRRLPRGLRYGAGAKSVANAIGRIFALHLVAAVPLWDVKVISMGRNRVVAAWDYLRGILIEIKGTLFGEDHGMTQSLILKSFLDAGGADALLQATRPFLIVQAATSKNLTETETTRASKVAVRAKMEELLKNSSLSVCSYLLAIGDVYDRLPRASSLMNTGGLSGGLPSADGEDTVMSSDSVRNQAHAISKIAVKESQVQADAQSEGSTKVQMRFEDLKSLLTSPSRKDALRAQTNRLREEAFAHCHEAAIRRVASDVWNTLCGFLHLLASCPGLLNSGASPIPDSPGRRTEWEARDIQRSALTVTLQLLTSVTSHPTELLAAFRPDGSAMSDVLGIVHTTSEVAAEMEGKKGTVPVKTRGPEEDGVPESRQFDPPPLRRPSPDPENLRSLVEMGFPERRAAYALRRTAPAGIEFAIEWLMTQMDEADDALQSDDAEEPRWQISAAENTTDNGETNRNPNDDAADEGDSNNEDDDNSSEGRSQAEDEESNGNADVVESDGAHNSEQSLDVADDNHDADSAMEDTEAADVDVSEQQDQGIHDEPAAPGSPNSGSPMSTGRGRSLGRSRQKPHRKPSTAKRKELLTLNVAADQDGRRLVEVALFNELALLSGALEKSSAVPDSDIPLYRSTAAGHIEMSSSSDLLNGGKPQDMSVRTVPIPIESFIAKKKQLFESLLDVTRTVIEACDQHEHGRHFPYLAIELLSVLQKSSSWLEKGSTEFAELVHKGLRLALEQQLGDGGLRHGLSGQTAAIWSHYGGNRARRALQQCGTFRLGYECLVRSIDEWETATAVPLVDIEATQPIKYLSIEEKKQDMCDTVSKKLAKTTGESNAGRLASTKRSMRSVTRSEAVKLKQITTCLLLLDASVRFESTDKIIESCKEVEKVPKSISAGKDSEEGDQEKMDTDEKNSELANQCEDDSQDPGAMNVSEARKALSEVMRDVFGTPSSAMEIDAVPADEEDVDLDTLHDRAQECKSVLVDKAEVEIMGWLSKKTEKTISSSFPTEALLSHCLSLLKLWNGVEVGDALLAVLQLLGSLTADWGLAQSAIDSGLTSELLRLPQLESHKSRSTNCKVARMLTRTILRHLIEDPESLHEAMVSELRSIFTSSQPRARVSYSMKSLISAASPMIARDLQCFLSALTKSVRTTNIRTSDSDGSQELELNDYKQLNTSEMESVLSHRSNVKSVISAISCLLSGTVLEHESREHQDSRLSATETLTNNGIERTAFALELLTDFVEFSQVAAVAFIKTPSPTSDISGSALDYIIQKFIPFPEAPETKNVSSQSLARVSSGREEVCIAARKLFLALCSKTANTHEDAVRGLARATKREADKEHACANVIAGLAQCIVPGTKFRVLRVVLETDFANDLARSLQRLDLSFEKNFEVASSVLRAITLIGRAATYMARHDDENPDDTPFGTSSRDPFGLRVQDDGLGHPGGFMVL